MDPATVNVLLLLSFTAFVCSIIALIVSFKNKSFQRDPVTEKLRSLLENISDLTTISTETEEKIKSAVNQYVEEQFPGIFDDDEDLRETLLAAVKKELPKLVEDVFASEAFRKKLTETTSEYISDSLENAFYSED